MSKLSKNKPVKGYTEKDMRAVSDNPKWTKKDFDNARSFAEVFPELAATIRRRGRQKSPTKKAISLRLDRDVLEAYQAFGDGWQTRINNDLRKMQKLD